MAQPPNEPPASPGRFAALGSKIGESKGWKSSKKGFDYLWTKAQPVREQFESTR